MKNKRFPFIGTLIAIVAIVIMVVVYKFALKEDFKRKETVVEPTEPTTFAFLPDTRLEALPTE